jgi:hypothetical protein
MHQQQRFKSKNIAAREKLSPLHNAGKIPFFFSHDVRPFSFSGTERQFPGISIIAREQISWHSEFFSFFFFLFSSASSSHPVNAGLALTEVAFYCCPASCEKGSNYVNIPGGRS